MWKRETDLEGCFVSCSWDPAWEEGLCAGAALAGALPPALCEHVDGGPGSRGGLGHAGGRACGSGPTPLHTLGALADMGCVCTPGPSLLKLLSTDRKQFAAERGAFAKFHLQMKTVYIMQA